MGSHDGRGEKAGPWDCARRWSAPLPCRAVCWAMAECSTPVELRRRRKAGPGAFGCSPTTCGTVLAAGPEPLPPVRPTTFAATQGETEPQSCKSISERGQWPGILGWRPNERVLHKMSETQKVWLSNLMTVPDPMDAEITRLD